MKPKYYSLDVLINQIEEPNRKICYTLLADNKELFEEARGSSHNHQAWGGGYLNHITETMNIAILLYNQLNSARPLPFSLSDTLLVLYLHDLEKPWRYIKQKDGSWKVNPELANKETQVEPFVNKKIAEYGFILSDEHWNGLRYVEGEKNDYSPTKRTQTPLAAFVHICDTWSARGWPNYPKEIDDSWEGAKRKNNL